MAKIQARNIVISRTDSIGDVVLTLPLAGILKEAYPDAKIIFLGNTYTAPIIRCSKHVDEVWEWAIMQQWSYQKQVQFLQEREIDTFIHVFPRKEIARVVKKAGIDHRIGTSHRAFHILTCNHMVNFTRKRSHLHEAQLNTKLLKPFGIKKLFPLDTLTQYLGFSSIPTLSDDLKKLLDPTKKKLVLHPKSQGSAIEWGVDKFVQLAKALDPEQWQVFFTGTENEGLLFRDQIPQQDNIIDVSGKMSLDDLIAFIASSDALVAASTGPLHIAGVCNIKTIGLFAEIKPIHSGRWQPLGNQVTIIKAKKNSDRTQPLDIDVRDVLQALK